MLMVITMLNNINGQLTNNNNAAEAFIAYFSSIFVHDDGNLPPFAMHDIKCKFNDDIDFSLGTIVKLLTDIKDTKAVDLVVYLPFFYKN